MYMISIHAVVHLPAYAIYLDFFLLWKRSRLVDSDLTVASILKHVGLKVHGYLTQCPPTPPIPPMRSQPAQKSVENHRPRLNSYKIKDMVIIPIPPQYSRQPRTNTLTLVTPMFGPSCRVALAGSLFTLEAKTLRRRQLIGRCRVQSVFTVIPPRTTNTHPQTWPESQFSSFYSILNCPLSHIILFAPSPWSARSRKSRTCARLASSHPQGYLQPCCLVLEGHWLRPARVISMREVHAMATWDRRRRP